MIRYYLTAVVLFSCTRLFAQSTPQLLLTRAITQQFVGNTWITTDSCAYSYPPNGSSIVTRKWLEMCSRAGGISRNYDANLCFEKLIPNGGTAVNVNQTIDLTGNITFYRYVSQSPQSTFEQREYRSFSGKTLVELYTSRQGPNAPNSTRDSFFYSGGKLQYVKHYINSFQQWQIAPGYETRYFYNGVGNVYKVEKPYTPAVFSKTDLYSYDLNNRVTAIIRMGPGGPGVYPNQDTIIFEQFTYNSAGDTATEEAWWRQGSNQDLTRLYRFTNSYDANHRLTEQLAYLPDATGWVIAGKRTMIYDQTGIITGLDYQRWNGTQWTDIPDTTIPGTAAHRIRLEYAMNWPVTIPKTEAANHIKLYPSPASDFIGIEAEWKNAQPFTAAILDMQGRIVRKWNETATKKYTRTISLTELPAGMYIIKLNCGNEQYSERFTVYK